MSVLLAAGSSAQITPGQVDTFAVGSTSGWQIGPLGAASPWVPTVVADGGPAGEGDAFLIARSSGTGTVGSKLVIYNDVQWTGDYLAAMVSHITMDVQNRGENSVMLRLYVESTSGDEWISADSVLVESASDWQRVTFPLSETALTGGTNYSTAMQSVKRLRILHGEDRFFSPVGIEAEIGIDNITAVPVDTAVDELPELLPYRIVSVYPNPTTDQVYVTLARTANEAGRADVGVYDLLGRRVADWSNQLGTSARVGSVGNTVQIQGSLVDVPAGLYFIRVADASGVDTRPVVVAAH